ncbi:MAG: DUF2332 domain-containing protein [Vitreoscilla sp.]|nr:DUF2332 domain-containing protein [Vitreoscilla sp.]
MTPAPDSLARLAAPFDAFARQDCSTEPLYAALALALAARPPLLGLLQAAPPTQRRPTLLLAALHDRLLALAEAGAPLPPLAAYYPSLGGVRPPDSSLGVALEAFVAEHGGALRETIATQRTQTNEIGRSAVLWPALAEISRRHGGRPLALFDFGCSAGLNLSVDGFQVAYSGAATLAVGPGAPAAPRVACRLVGGVPPWTPWTIAHRQGVDLAPIDLDDTGALRWLRACLWPSEHERATRFEQAVALARAARHPVVRSDDGISVLARWLSHLPAGVTPVMFNSWVLAYFTGDELARHTERVLALVQDHGLVWLSAEDETRLAATSGLAAAPGLSAHEPGTPTYWSLSEPGRDGPAHSLLARSHPHGVWLEWLAG